MLFRIVSYKCNKFLIEMPDNRCYTTDKLIRLLDKRWTSLFP